MNEPQFEQARDAVKKILDILKITRVVCVDDIYADEPAVEDVIVAAGKIEAETLEKLLPELGGSVPNDPDVLSSLIRRLWGELNPEIARRRARILLSTAFPDKPENRDLKDASALAEVIPSVTELSPQQWSERTRQLFDENSGQRTLFLFDQDLSRSGGDEGIRIISSLLAGQQTKDLLICGLLTHTITPEEQPTKWLELSNTYSISRDRFLVIPKRHLGEDPIVFAQNLKWVALSPDFVLLKEKTQKIISEAALDAANHVNDITIYDLDHIVFQVSAKEGLWEPDELFRLHALFHRLESRRLAYEGGELESIANRLRSVSHIPTQSASMHFTTWKIQQKAIYESADYLNRYHLPLELGDIFMKTDSTSTKRYILLAQPCDLMVRSDGSRQPDLVHVPLAEIGEVEPKLDQRHCFETMESCGETPNKNWYVKFKQVHQVHVCLLDLCVFNTDGSAIMEIGAEAPPGMRPAWKARYAILSKIFEKLIGRVTLLYTVDGERQEVTHLQEKLKSVLTVGMLNEGLFKGSLIEQEGHRSIKYNCRRLGRLSRDRAFGLLMAYTGILSRPAYESSFS